MGKVDFNALNKNMSGKEILARAAHGLLENEYDGEPEDFEHPAPAIVDPLDPAPLIKLLENYVAEIDKMDLKATSLVVKDDDSNDLATTMTNQAKKLKQIVNKKHQALKSPYLKVTQPLDSFRKMLSDRLEKVERIVNSKIKPYLQKLEAKRVEKQRKADEAARIEQERLDAEANAEADRIAGIARKKALAEGKKQDEADAAAKAAAELAEPAPVVVAETVAETKIVTGAGTAKLKPTWDWEITDFKAIPDEAYNMRKKEVTEALKPWINPQIKIGIRNIAGVKIFQVSKMETRTKR